MCSKGKQLVLAQLSCEGRRSGFYVMDLEADKGWTTPIAPILEFGMNEIVCLGSVVYYVSHPLRENSELWDKFKEYGHLSTGISCFDFSSKQNLLELLESREREEPKPDLRWKDDDPFKPGSLYFRWKDAPAMSHPRYYSSCVTLGGKIYSLGGTAVESCIGEVFTPKTGEWKPLPEPPKDVHPLKHRCVSYPVIADEKNNRILVHFNHVGALYAYYPGAGGGGEWDCLAPELRRWERVSALFEGVIYSHFSGEEGWRRDCIDAYDVMTRSWLKVVYSVPFPDNVCINQYENVLCLGDGVLCLAGCFPVFKDYRRLLHSAAQFVKLRVNRTTPTEVHVTLGAITDFVYEDDVIPINFTLC